jgi:uncharacterized membrane protein
VASKPPATQESQINIIEAEIASELDPLIRPDKKREAAQVVAMIIRKFHSGPLPAPDDFQQYEDTLAGSADRIMTMAEKEQNHRHKRDLRIVSSEYMVRILGQVGAMVALAMLVGLVAYCASVGQPLAAGVIGAVGAVVVGFLRYSSQKVDAPPEPAKPPAKRRKR